MVDATGAATTTAAQGASLTQVSNSGTSWITALMQELGEWVDQKFSDYMGAINNAKGGGDDGNGGGPITPAGGDTGAGGQAGGNVVGNPGGGGDGEVGNPANPGAGGSNPSDDLAVKAAQGEFERAMSIATEAIKGAIQASKSAVGR